MSTIDSRVEISSRSVIELRKLLRDVCQSPNDYLEDRALRSALRSQGKLAAYSNEGRSIVGRSLNTLKRISDEFAEGGFDALNSLRKTALQRIEDVEQRGKGSNKRTRAGLAQNVNELEGQVRLLEQVNFALVLCLSESVADIRSVANIDDMGARKQRASDAIKKLAAMLAINPPPFDELRNEANVIHFRDK